MEELHCILCSGRDINITESINTNDLIKLYKTRAAVDVRKFFTQKNIDYCTCNNCGLIFFWPQAVGDGSFYDDLQQSGNYYPKERTEFIEASGHIKNSDDILEIGCGNGAFADFIKCKSYTGLEFSEMAITHGRKKGLNILKQSIEDHLGENKGKYDVVCYFQVLEHVKKPGEFISDSVKCLKPGGKLIIAVPSEDSFINKAVNFYLTMPPHHASRWTDETLKKVAGISQLELTQIFHERLHPDHKLFYLKTNLYRKFISLLGLNYKRVNLAFIHTLLYGIAVIFSYLLKFAILGNIKGHSVVVIYKKV